MNIRHIRHRLLQKLFWNRPGFALLRGYIALRNRADFVLLNYSLDSETNGEHWLLDQLAEAPVIFDVGFNAGDFTSSVLAARPGASVFAFDPARFAARVWKDAFANDGRIRFVPLALSKEEGELEFHDYDNMCSSLAVRGGSPSPAEVYRVPVGTLDNWCSAEHIDRIDLLKIDAEGYDLHVLEGASGMLRDSRIEMFMFEYADGWIDSRRFLREAADYLREKPYKLYRLFNGFLAPFDYANRSERFDLGCMFVGIADNAAKVGPPIRRGLHY